MSTAGVTLHLILPHSLLCPADTYFTQIAMHYPHFQYLDGQTVTFGHYEDPLSDQLATQLPTDLQNVPYYCSVSSSLLISLLVVEKQQTSFRRCSHYPQSGCDALFLRGSTGPLQSRKLQVCTPHNDTVEDILDAVGLSSDNLPPSLYEFYLVMIYKQQLLSTTIFEFKHTDHAGKQLTSHLENVTLQEIYAKISNDPTLCQDLERRTTIETIV